MSINFNRRTLKISVLCFVGVLACTTGIIYGKDKENEAMTKEIKSTPEVASIEKLIGEDGFEDFINKTNLDLKNEADRQLLAAKAAELEQAKKEYTNWVDGIDLREYFKDSDYKDYLIVDIDGKNTNIRKEPDEDSERVGIIPNHGIAKIKDEEDAGGKKWYRIESGSVDDGYILGDYVKTGDEAIKLMKHVGYLSIVCNSNTMNVRKEQSTDSDVITKISESNHVAVLGINRDWVKVSVGDNEGYVSREYVDVEFYLPTATAVKEKKSNSNSNGGSSSGGGNANSTGGSVGSGGSETGRSIAAEGLKYVGCDYVPSGETPEGGFDCSGFTRYVYGKFGISLPHQSGQQRSYGSEVSMDDIAPGDLVCYSGHVAIYIGDGRIVHASTPRTGVTTGNLNMMNVITIRRLA